LGITGPTGAGKTTLLRLLLRQFDLKDGDILIGGRSIKSYPGDDWRSVMGYVPQDHFLFSATIRENIAFAKPEATMEEIMEAAHMASIHDEILRFDTDTTPRWGKGVSPFPVDKNNGLPSPGQCWLTPTF
jgi:ATP-binding cassette subfamily B protein